MKNLILPSLLLTTLILSISCFIIISAYPIRNQVWQTPPQIVTPQGGKTIVFCTDYGMGTKNLDDITTWLTGLGHTCRIANDDITTSILSGADALILGSFYGAPSGIEELNATNAATLYNTILNWFNEGNKFLWVSGDDDYGGREWILGNASAILENVSSPLRFEKAGVEDTKSNIGGASYRVVANAGETANPDGAQISQNVNSCLFHGPTCLYAVYEGIPVPLENATIGNVFSIYYTSTTGLIVDYTPPPSGTAPAAHVTGSKGHWVMMAGEKFAGPLQNNKIIASGAAPYGDYQPMWTDQYYGVNLEGDDLVKQAILWGLSSNPTAPSLADPGVIDNDGTFIVNWIKSTDLGGYIDHYQLHMSNSNIFSIFITQWNTSSTNQTISGLSSNTYYFRVRAFDNDGNPGPWSNIVDIIVQLPTTPTPIPGFPIATIIIGTAAALCLSLIIRRRRKL